MKGFEVHGKDLHGGVENEANPNSGFDAMEAIEEELGVIGEEERQIWLEREQDNLLDVDDAPIFYGEFPPLPDFPCMSSSSSSSSTPATAKAIATSSSSSSATSSSSAASWAVLKSDADEDVEKNNDHHHVYRHELYDTYYDHHHQGQNDPLDAPSAALSSTASMEIPQPSDQGMEGVDCMDVVENFGYMDLLEDNNFFDPSSIFQQDDENFLEVLQRQHKPAELDQPNFQQGNEEELMIQSRNEESQQGGEGASDDLAMVFLDWLKTNKETVSAEDLRRVKIKKATIDSAARRLGGGKEAMKQLLKLILEWVQTNHLQKSRMRESSSNIPRQYRQDPLQSPNPSPNPTSNPNLNSNFSQSSWNPPPPCVTDPMAVPGFPPPMVGYMGNPFINGSGYPPHPPDYHTLESAQSWHASQFTMASQYTSFTDNKLAHPSFSGYTNQYPYAYIPGHGGDRLVKLGSSATKEARKKRMARQRRFLSHHRNHNHQHHHNQHQNSSADPHAIRLGTDSVGPQTGQANPGNWVFWPAAAGATAPSTPLMTLDAPAMGSTVDRSAMQPQNYQRQPAAESRQGWKPEKNLRFLLQKVLKQSDVGNLGRIVLPKKEAETHLPELEARDGISIAMEDIGTSRVWNMRYRFWPNNKSRMYLLENTGDFVRTNGLQEGDFIVIYSDVKCGKYLIRGVKVRQPGPKSESKRPAKLQRNVHANSPCALNASS